MTYAIETLGLSKRYDSRQVLNEVNVRAPSRQITSVVGVNGSGKTTLLRILAGLEPPSGGKILVDARKVGPDELRAHCTMVFQKSVMFSRMVYDNVAYGLRLNRGASQGIPEKVSSALALVNLEGFEKRKARKLSSGEQQRVALARALALGRRVLLVDEPTANIDPANAMIIERAIKESAKSGAVLLSTHNLPQARRLSDRVIHLYGGRVVEEGEPSCFFTKPIDERTRLFIEGELQF